VLVALQEQMVRRTTNSSQHEFIDFSAHASCAPLAQMKRAQDWGIFPTVRTNPREPALSRRALDAVIARVYIADSVFQAQKHAF